MQWFVNLKTGKRLAIGSALVMALTVMLVGVAVSRMARMNDSARLIKEDATDGLAAVAVLNQDIFLFRQRQYQMVLENDKAEISKAEQELLQKQAEVEKNLAAYEPTITQAEDRANFQTLKSSWQAFLATVPAIAEAANKNEDSRACALIKGESLRLQQAVQENLARMTDRNKQRGDLLMHEAEATYRSARTNLLCVAAFALLLNALFAWYNSRLITVPLTQTAERLERMRAVCITNLTAGIRALAAGDLTQTPEYSTTPAVPEAQRRVRTDRRHFRWRADPYAGRD